MLPCSPVSFHAILFLLGFKYIDDKRNVIVMNSISRLHVHFGTLLVSGFGPAKTPCRTDLGEIQTQSADAFVRSVRDTHVTSRGSLYEKVERTQRRGIPQDTVLIRFRTDNGFDANQLEMELAEALEAAGLTTQTFGE